jgi:hypothetical protein
VARIRSIKPDFFINDELAELEPLTRLFFIGLWTQADREGRMHDRPRRLRAALVPYDDCDVTGMLDALAESGHIMRYEVDGERYIQVLNFTRHQHVNIKESASTVPAPCQYPTSTEEGKGEEGKGEERESRTDDDFTTLWSVYPVHTFKALSLSAFRSFKGDVQDLIAAASCVPNTHKQTLRYFIEDGTWQDFIPKPPPAPCTNAACMSGYVVTGDVAAPCPVCNGGAS